MRSIRNRCESRQCRDQRDKVVAPPADFFVIAIIYLIERVASGIASPFASADAFVVTDATYRPRNPKNHFPGNKKIIPGPHF
jgi:hypothetical protein